MYERLINSKIITPTILNEQYRSHPHIINFSNKLFYNNEITTNIYNKLSKLG